MRKDVPGSDWKAKWRFPLDVRSGFGRVIPPLLIVFKARPALMAWRPARAHVGWWLPAHGKAFSYFSVCHSFQGLWQFKRKWRCHGECLANWDEMIKEVKSISFLEVLDLKTMASKWKSHDTDPFPSDGYLNWHFVFMFMTYMVGMSVLRGTGFKLPTSLQRSSLSQAAWCLIRAKFCWHCWHWIIKCGLRFGLLCFVSIVWFLELEAAINVPNKPRYIYPIENVAKLNKI